MRTHTNRHKQSNPPSQPVSASPSADTHSHTEVTTDMSTNPRIHESKVNKLARSIFDIAENMALRPRRPVAPPPTSRRPAPRPSSALPVPWQVLRTPTHTFSWALPPSLPLPPPPSSLLPSLAPTLHIHVMCAHCRPIPTPTQDALTTSTH